MSALPRLCYALDNTYAESYAKRLIEISGKEKAIATVKERIIKLPQEADWWKMVLEQIERLSK